MAMLDSGLAQSALEHPGEEIAAKELQEMLALSDAGEHAAAAARAAKALEGGVTDARVLGLFFLGLFIERGPVALDSMFATLIEAMGPRWDALRPEERKERITDGALGKLFRTTNSVIDFHEATRDATWKAWLAQGSPELGGRALEAANTLFIAMEERIEDTRATAQLSELKVRIESHFSRATAPQRPVAQPVNEPSNEPSNSAGETAEDESAPKDEPTSRSAPRRAADTPPSDARTIEVSPALELFMRKLEAFERLVARGDMERAAIVAEDIRRIVEAFDPRVYFPKLLSPHYRTLSAHVEDIAPHWESMGSLSWKVLEQLYQVDLDAFAGE